MFSYVFEHVSAVTLSEIKWDYLFKCKSGMSKVCNSVEVNCLEAIQIVHHLANGRFDWLIFWHHSVDVSREAISMLSGKYKRFTFVYPVICIWIGIRADTTARRLKGQG